GRNEAYGILVQPLGREFLFDIARKTEFAGFQLFGGIARILTAQSGVIGHTTISFAGTATNRRRGTSASAPRIAAFAAMHWARAAQAESSAHSCRPSSTQAASAIGPSTAATTSARLIGAAGRASWSPPCAQRAQRSRPAALSTLTSFCTVGT